MIVLDTHIWVWWVHGDTHLTDEQTRVIQQSEADGLVDRNPQKFVDIYKAVEADFQKATERVYRSRQNPSHLKLSVIK